MHGEIEQKLRLCPQLPSLSGIALRLVAATRNPSIDLDTLANLVSHDPALSARLLRVANSSLYPQFRKVRNLTQAIQVLGLNTTVTLSLGFSISAGLKQYRTAGIDLDAFWRRSMLSALAARLLGQQCELQEIDELFLAALLQDIGRLALDAALPYGRYAATQVNVACHDELVTRERERLGTDHLEAGAWLLEEWRLPKFFKLAVWGSHDHSRRGNLGELTLFIGCVAASGPVADIYLSGNTAAATQTAQHAAKACLDLDAPDLNAVLDRLVTTLPEIEELFATPVLSPPEAEGLTAQTREIIMCRNLRELNALSHGSSEAEDIKQAADQLYDVAYRDALTAAYNRRYFDEALETAFAEAGGERQPLSLAYVDLDHFKAVNDSHGHAVGDTVLTEVAATIQTYLRPTDLLARYGGEEFVVLLPGLDGATALSVLERIRAGIEALATSLPGGATVSTTLSAGVATYGGHNHGQMKPSGLIDAADLALYQAKKQGRNRIVQAS